ncbi:MAG: YraN family protein [Clostridia bacterium]|nr:YraN family protein [Clostridia bacterium]
MGQKGEETAVKILAKQGYKIIERNFRTKMGEIDIIARDKEYTCFVEVRLRKNNNFGTPADTIDARKRQRIINTAKYYAQKKRIYDTPMRFDVVVINADTFGEELSNISAEVIKDAFRL